MSSPREWIDLANQLYSDGDTRAGMIGASCERCHLPIAFNSKVDRNDLCQCIDVSPVTPYEVLAALGLEDYVERFRIRDLTNVG